MENLRHLLAAIAALTLVLSVVSSVSPGSFTGLNAFAEDDDEDNDHSGASSGSNNNDDDDEDEESGNQTSSHGAKDDDKEHGNNSSNSTRDDEEDDDENNGKDHGVNSNDDDERGQGHEKSGLRVDDDGIKVDVEMDTNMTDGTYRAAFICDTPAVNKTLDNMFEVESGVGELEAEIALDNGTYSGCELVLVGTNTSIASFDSFTVQEDTEQGDDDHESERHQERRHDIVSKTTGREIHERHISANASSPGDYKPGWNYTLMADGTAMNGTTSTANATVSIDVAVWKSTPAIVLLDITGGTIEIGGHEYDVRIGYALYSTEHGVMRLGALVSDDSDNILKLKLYGNASEGAELPMQAGQSIDMSFDSNPSGNGLEGWALTLEGTVKAG
jgi:hypothetical protein